RPFARITLGLPHPIPQRLTRAADLFGNRLDGSPLRGVLALVLEHHPNRPLPHLGGVLLCLSHDPNLSKVGASGQPGAVHPACPADTPPVSPSDMPLTPPHHGLPLALSPHPTPGNPRTAPRGSRSAAAQLPAPAAANPCGVSCGSTG